MFGDRDLDPFFQIVIEGRPIVKKNTKKYFGRGRVVYTRQYIDWNAYAVALLKQNWKQPEFDSDCVAVFRFYFKNKQGEADVSNLIEGPQDSLVDAGILLNDKQVKGVLAYKEFDGYPRTEIALYKWSDIFPHAKTTRTIPA